MIAVSLLPIGNASLIYGSSDGGTTLSSSYPFDTAVSIPSYPLDTAGTSLSPFCTSLSSSYLSLPLSSSYLSLTFLLLHFDYFPYFQFIFFNRL